MLIDEQEMIDLSLVHQIGESKENQAEEKIDEKVAEYMAAFLSDN